MRQNHGEHLWLIYFLFFVGVTSCLSPFAGARYRRADYWSLHPPLRPFAYDILRKRANAENMITLKWLGTRIVRFTEWYSNELIPVVWRPSLEDLLYFCENSFFDPVESTFEWSSENKIRFLTCGLSSNICKYCLLLIIARGISLMNFCVSCLPQVERSKWNCLRLRIVV